MALKLYNTLTRKKEDFKPIKKGHVGMYVCGPTVNDVPHLGHARMQITFDILRKHLKFLGYKVKFVSNITDVDDKIINKAKELKEDIQKLTERNIKAHMEEYAKIGVEEPDVQPRATEYIKEMIELIRILEKKGYTYVIDGDGVYYDLSKFKDYGKLSHQDILELRSGARVKENEGKKMKEDFVLWKFSKPGEPMWDSPWGKGRPGWHIECSAMSESILGVPFDIHGGGQDLMFPHHEDEIAQTEAAYEKNMANFWIHNGMVNVDNVKMSKSLGNFKTIGDLLKNYDPEVIRYLVLSTHYRKPLDFAKGTLDSAKSSYERLKNFVSAIEDDKKINEDVLKDFEKAMSDDLNTSKVLADLWNFVRDDRAVGKIKTIKKMDEVLGLNLLKKEKLEISSDVKKLLIEREKARKAKDWKKSDEIRDEIKKNGFNVLDSSDGQKLEKIK